MDQAPQTKPRRRHLMDPDNLQASRRRKDPMSLTQVQRWVGSSLAVTTIMHMAFGLVLAAWYVDESRTVDRIGLLVVAGMFGTVAMGVGFLIHQKSPLTPWLLVGWLPTLVGAFWLF